MRVRLTWLSKRREAKDTVFGSFAAYLKKGRVRVRGKGQG